MPAVERFLAEDGWDTALVVAHGAVNRAILSWALTGERSFLGRFEQAPCCVNVLDVTHGGEPDWIVRAVNVAASDLAHRSTRQTTMEQYWAQYRAAPDGGAARHRLDRHGDLRRRAGALELRHRLEGPVRELR